MNSFVRRTRINACAVVFLFSMFLALSGGAVRAASPFAGWAAVVVSGDWHAHDGRPSAIFDNARRDVTHDLVGLGFSSRNIAGFSARPGATHPASLRAVATALWRMSRRASSGCLLYFTSHGSPNGILLGDSVLGPRTLGATIDRVCGKRPTVVVLSSCFSGVFVPALARPNRIILTAARRDRTSFGCGQTDRYPYFDKCVLSVWPYANGFPALGRAAQLCVAARERREHVGPPSEPQLFVGADAARRIPHWRRRLSG
ncbi:MAG: C13 family peptidase [Rhizomicrobium sp.]